MSRTRRLPFLLSLVSTVYAQVVPLPERISARQFPIMAWGNSPTEPAHLAGMREAGLNISGFCRIADVDAVRAAGLGCLVRDPRINGHDWTNLPPDDKLRGPVAEAVRAVKDNPAVAGFYLRDEPSAALLPGLARMSRLIEEFAPGLWPYVNLFPTYASAQQLGSPDYETYLRSTLSILRPPFLSYDHYALRDGEMRDSFFQNLDSVRTAAMEARVPFWNCILSNTLFHYMEPSDATLHLQVFATLAYGGRGIQYFTYYTPPYGNFRSAPIDPYGNRTATWDALRRVNLELHALAPRMLKLRSTGVYHSPFNGSPLLRTVTTSGKAKDRFLIGEFTNDQGEPYFMIVNKSLTTSFRFQMEANGPKQKLVRVSNYTGKDEPMREEMDWLAPGAGLLLRWQ